jgi:hypothetical protein
MTETGNFGRIEANSAGATGDQNIRRKKEQNYVTPFSYDERNQPSSYPNKSQLIDFKSVMG